MSSRHANSGLIAANRAALREIAEILEIYPRAVIVGGSVPYLLIPQEAEPHEGTVDIDIVLDINQPGADDELTLHEILERRLFVQDPKKPFRYLKGIDNHQVLIELLAGGTPPPNGHRYIGTEDVHVTVIPGMEVALENPREVHLSDGSNLTILVASLPAFLSMKAVALSRREELKGTKDAYDIIYCLRNYPGGAQAVAKEFLECISNPTVASGVGLLRELFASKDSKGPVAYAKKANEAEDSALRQLEAFTRVEDLLLKIDDYGQYY